jgi:hypothetical protein
MLEKYKKLAHDASLNGDRVQTEYYLQFADHYFRVIADTRSQKDEQRPRREDREQDEFGETDGDYEDNANRRDRERRDDDDAHARDAIRAPAAGARRATKRGTAPPVASY